MIGTFNSSTGREIGEEWELTTWQGTIFNGEAHFFAAVGGFAADFLIRRWGRKKPSMVLMAGVFFGFVTIAGTSKAYFWLAFLARAFQGVFMGALTTLAPLYIVELAPERFRGAVGSLHQLSSAFGISYLNLIDIWCSWRLITILAAVIQIIYLICAAFVRESPAVERTEALIVKESLLQKKYMYGLVHTFALALFQQLAGMDAILTNLNSIFRASETMLSPEVCAYVVTLATLISGCCAAAVIHKLGRRPVWIISSAGQMTGLLLAFADQFWHIGGVLPIVSFFIDVLCYDLGMGPIPWIITPELFPDEVRSLACSLTTGFNWLLSSVIMLIWPTMRDKLGIHWSFLAFGCCCLVSILYGIFFMPETKDDALGKLKGDQKEEIVQVEDELLAGQDQPRKYVSP
jgi:MFS family permease